jgi:Rrf2 family protein
MLCLSRKIDYALVALAFLADRETGPVVSAREVAQINDLPLPLVAKILKRLHRQGLVDGVRGSKGGYRLSVDLDSVSLIELIAAVEDGNPTQRTHRHGPVQALHYRLMKFLRDIKLSDLVVPGRRIDVPLELVANPI